MKFIFEAVVQFVEYSFKMKKRKYFLQFQKKSRLSDNMEFWTLLLLLKSIDAIINEGR